MEYRGYQAIVEFDEEAGVLSGHVINTRDVIHFQGESVQELRQAFIDSVDDYIEFCESRGESPEKPFSGRLPLRIDPILHQQVYCASKRSGLSINAYITDCLIRVTSEDSASAPAY